MSHRPDARQGHPGQDASLGRWPWQVSLQYLRHHTFHLQQHPHARLVLTLPSAALGVRSESAGPGSGSAGGVRTEAGSPRVGARLTCSEGCGQTGAGLTLGGGGVSLGRFGDGEVGAGRADPWNQQVEAGRQVGVPGRVQQGDKQRVMKQRNVMWHLNTDKHPLFLDVFK